MEDLFKMRLRDYRYSFLSKKQIMLSELAKTKSAVTLSDAESFFCGASNSYNALKKLVFWGIVRQDVSPRIWIYMDWKEFELRAKQGMLKEGVKEHISFQIRNFEERKICEFIR